MKDHFNMTRTMNPRLLKICVLCRMLVNTNLIDASSELIN